LSEKLYEKVFNFSREDDMRMFATFVSKIV